MQFVDHEADDLVIVLSARPSDAVPLAKTAEKSPHPSRETRSSPTRCEETSAYRGRISQRIWTSSCAFLFARGTTLASLPPVCVAIERCRSLRAGYDSVRPARGDHSRGNTTGKGRSRRKSSLRGPSGGISRRRGSIEGDSGAHQREQIRVLIFIGSDLSIYQTIPQSRQEAFRRPR